MANVQVKTVAQALRRVKLLKGKVAELKGRAAQCVSFVESKKPAFDFAELRKELAAAKEELVKLEAAVARANATHTFEFEGRQVSLTEAVRRLQELKDELAWLKGLTLQEGKVESSDYEYDDNSRRVRVSREVTWLSALSEKDRVAEVDQLQDKFQQLNDLVETANHRVELRELQV